jgi:hypothetical protein
VISGDCGKEGAVDIRIAEDLTTLRANVRRRALLAAGGSGIVAALAWPSAAPSARKGKQRCNREKRQCRQQIQTFCGANDACLASFLKCCDTCKVGAGIICALGEP